MTPYNLSSIVWKKILHSASHPELYLLYVMTERFGHRFVLLPLSNYPRPICSWLKDQERVNLKKNAITLSSFNVYSLPSQLWHLATGIHCAWWTCNRLEKTMVPQWIRGRSYSAAVHEASRAMTSRKTEIVLAYLDFSDFPTSLG